MKNWINFLNIETSETSKQFIKMRNVKLNDITYASNFIITSLNEYIFIRTLVQIANLKYVQRLFRFKTMYYLKNIINLTNQNEIYFRTFIKHFKSLFLLNVKRKRVILSKASILFF
mmetsp:Transcript_30839/g.42973  ORF Transcript_30839/g.42973 Transcript_30839/m.42973 type:complete len:116 (+) Transcript_30839:897-1244(+)